jgi:probable phosphoglycerate mutase
MSSTRVFLLRHAESAVPNVFHGAESDVDLSLRGRQQAVAIAEVLARVRPAVVVSSAMRRACETARPIAERCGVPHLFEPLLHERRVAGLSGLPYADNDIWPETVRRWSAGETGYAHDGAETFDDIRNRVVPVWERIMAQHTGQSLVVVAHGIVCKVLLLSLFADWTWTGIGSIRNVAINELVRDKLTWTALRINDWPPEIVALEEQRRS